jgi:hypothetical protein
MKLYVLYVLSSTDLAPWLPWFAGMILSLGPFSFIGQMGICSLYTVCSIPFFFCLSNTTWYISFQSVYFNFNHRIIFVNVLTLGCFKLFALNILCWSHFVTRLNILHTIKVQNFIFNSLYQNFNIFSFVNFHLATHLTKDMYQINYYDAINIIKDKT